MAATLWRRDGFVDDLLPSVFEDMVRNPGDYVVEVRGTTDEEEAYLVRLYDLFSGRRLSERPQDLLRVCVDAVLEWRHSLPSSVGHSRRLSTKAREFDRALASTDPGALFLDILPREVGAEFTDVDALILGIAEIKDEFDRVPRRRERQAIQVLAQVLVDRGAVPAAGRDGGGVRHLGSQWAACIPESVASHLPDHVAKGVLTRLQTPFRDDRTMVQALSTLLVGLPVGEWDQSSLPVFRARLRQAMDQIESTGLEMMRKAGTDEALQSGMGTLVKARIWSAATRLADVIGPAEAAIQLEMMAADLREDPQSQLDVA